MPLYIDKFGSNIQDCFKAITNTSDSFPLAVYL